MGIGICCSIFDRDGNPTVLKSGYWYCYNCHTERKFIPYPCTGTIEKRCRCGSTVVYQLD